MIDEEIEKLKKKLNFDKNCHASGYITGDKDETISIKEIENILQHIEQLESKVKEVTDKCIKDMRKNNEFEFLPLQVEKAYNNYYKIGKIEEAQEILEMLEVLEV